MWRVFVGLSVGIFIGLAIGGMPTSFAQGPPSAPSSRIVTNWAWPTEVEPTAALVGPAQMQTGSITDVITLTFRESNGAIKIVRMTVRGGGPAPNEYVVITLSPQR
jgi:hypothetical protein